MPQPEMSGAKLALKRLLLSDEYRTTLAEVQADYEDGVVLEPVAFVHTAEKSALHGYPSIEMIGLASEPIGVGQQAAQEYRHHLVVVLHVLGDDEETVTAQVERHILALRRLFFNRLLTDVTGSADVIPGREDFEPIVREKPDAGPFLKAGTIELRVPTWA